MWPIRSRILSSGSMPRRAASAACSFSSTPATWLTNNSAEAYITHSEGRASSAAVGNDTSQFSTGSATPLKISGMPLPASRRSAAVQIMGRCGMVKGFQLQAIVFIPAAGPDVQAGHVVRLLLVQTLPQQLAKEVVVAIPAPLVVQRDDEEVGAFEVGQGFLPGCGGVLQDGIAQRATQAVEYGGAQQKGLNAGGLPLEHFLHQVVQDETMAAAESLDEGCGVFSSLHREGRQLQTGNPALGTRFQRGDLLRR